MSKKTPLENFQDTLYLTKSARFNAEKRLNLKHKMSMYALSILSVYAIMLSLPDSVNTSWLISVDPELRSSTSIFISIAIIVLSLIEAGSNTSTQAHQFHQNALRISNLYRESLTCIDKDLPKLKSDYAEILKELPFNHDTFDYEWAIMMNSHRGGGERFWCLGKVIFKAIFHQYILYILISLGIFQISF